MLPFMGSQTVEQDSVTELMMTSRPSRTKIKKKKMSFSSYGTGMQK